MNQGRYYTWLVAVLLIAIAAGLVNWPNFALPEITAIGFKGRSFPIREGLDLRGGTAVLLEADVPAAEQVSASAMESVRSIIERRVNGLGLTEATVQIQGERRLLVEMPGIEDPEAAIATIRATGFLEWIDAGDTFLTDGTVVRTDRTAGGGTVPVPTATAPVTGTVPLTPTVPLTATVPVTTGVTPTAEPPFFRTVISGKDLDPTSIQIGSNQGVPTVVFRTTADAASILADFTAQHNETVLGRPYYMCITIDKVVISCPSIRSALPSGQGEITLGGNATRAEADALAIQLRYGALQVPLKVAENRTVGATLGEDSVRKSIIAGIIGLLAVILFMLLYYRLPGVLAALALLLYAAVTFALFKIIPVTLTLPGIAGFVLSVGVAVDANILIFERMKEELRSGRRLDLAVEAGFARAWPSIRDSNISTLITCSILWLFGNAYGASIVKGFAITLALGVFVSLFTAITVTRTFLHVVLDRMDFGTQHWWFGV